LIFSLSGLGSSFKNFLMNHNPGSKSFG
jgi:hypothetical protein